MHRDNRREKIDAFLVSKLNIEKCLDDSCVYVKVDEDLKMVIVITLYVDDLRNAGKNLDSM